MWAQSTELLSLFLFARNRVDRLVWAHLTGCPTNHYISFSQSVCLPINVFVVVV